MYRAVVLTTLTLLLIAVTGITLAGESTFGPERDSLTEPTVQDTTTTGEPTDIADEESTETERSEPTAGGVTDDPTAPEAEEPEVTEVQATGGKTENMGRPVGVGKPKGAGVDPVGNGKAEDDEGDARGGGDQDKVTLCHKGKTLTVDAPARAAHVRHGDTVGSCLTEDAAPEPPEGTPGAGVAQNGDGAGGNGQQKVALCHKGMTLMVGELAKEAHLRHGDTEGPCAGQ